MLNQNKFRGFEKKDFANDKNGKYKFEKELEDKLIQEYLDQYTPLMIFPYDWLQKEPLFSVSGRARDLYQFLWGRKIISIRRRKFDKKGNPYIICSRKEAAEYLNVSEPTAGKCFRELRDSKLIREVNTSGNNMVFVRDAVKGEFRLKRLGGIIKKKVNMSHA